MLIFHYPRVVSVAGTWAMCDWLFSNSILMSQRIGTLTPSESPELHTQTQCSLQHANKLLIQQC